jgi:hypothetical protein
MTTLLDPEQIPLTNADFRKWMAFAGLELERLDMKHYDILTDYFVNGNGEAAERQRDFELFNLKWDLIGLKLAIKATYAIWKQVRAEMDWKHMLTFNENLDGFEGSDDIDDNETNNGDVMTIEDLIDNAETDEDTGEPAADDFCEDFIGTPWVTFAKRSFLPVKWMNLNGIGVGTLRLKKMLAQAKDSELAQRFWDERP